MKEAMEIAKIKQRKLETLQRKVHRGSRICDLFLCARLAGGARSFYEFKISILINFAKLVDSPNPSSCFFFPHIGLDTPENGSSEVCSSLKKGYGSYTAGSGGIDVLSSVFRRAYVQPRRNPYLFGALRYIVVILSPVSPSLPGPASSMRFACLFASALFLARLVL